MNTIHIGIDTGKITGIAAFDAAAGRIVWFAEIDHLSAELVDHPWPSYESVGRAKDSILSAINARFPPGAYLDVRITVEAVQLYGVGGGQVESTLRLEDRLSSAPGVRRMRGAAARHAAGISHHSGADKRVKSYLESWFGAGCFDRGLVCPRRKNKSHNDDCPICAGTGWRAPRGDLFGMGGHARDAAMIAIAAAMIDRDTEGKR